MCASEGSPGGSEPAHATGDQGRYIYMYTHDATGDSGRFRVMVFGDLGLSTPPSPLISTRCQQATEERKEGGARGCGPWGSHKGAEAWGEAAVGSGLGARTWGVRGGALHVQAVSESWS